MAIRVPAPDLDWRISRTCDGGQCIRVAGKGESVMIGSTGDPDGPVSEFTVAEWRHFLDGAKRGDFDGIAGSPKLVSRDRWDNADGLAISRTPREGSAAAGSEPAPARGEQRRHHAPGCS